MELLTNDAESTKGFIGCLHAIQIMGLLCWYIESWMANLLKTFSSGFYWKFLKHASFCVPNTLPAMGNYYLVQLPYRSWTQSWRIKIFPHPSIIDVMYASLRGADPVILPVQYREAVWAVKFSQVVISGSPGILRWPKYTGQYSDVQALPYIVSELLALVLSLYVGFNSLYLNNWKSYTYKWHVYIELGPSYLAVALFHQKNIAKHTTHTIVSWPNPSISDDVMTWKHFPVTSGFHS